MKWEHVATAPDQLTAEMWRELLQNEGVPAIIEPRDAVSFLGLSSMPCEVSSMLRLVTINDLSPGWAQKQKTENRFGG